MRLGQTGRPADPQAGWEKRACARDAADLPTKIKDFRGFYSGRILIVRGGILMSIGNFPEMLSQRILVGIILVGRLGVCIGRITAAVVPASGRPRVRTRA